jgi:transcriptional regulator with XRE-family HTH domain
MRNLGLALRFIREARRLSLAQLASGAGVGVPFLSLLERNERGASPDTWIRIADTLDVPRALFVAEDSSATSVEVDQLALSLERLHQAECAVRQKLGISDATT